MELGILHNSPPSTKRGCRAGRLHRLWHGLPPAPWPCTRSQHHSVPSRNLHPLMVPPFLQPHPDLQSAVGNAPLSSKHPAQLPTTDCLLSIISTMGGQPSDAPALSPPSPLQQGGQSSNAPALSPPSPLPQGGQPIALALSPPSPPPQGGQPSDAPGLSPSSSTLLLCPSNSTLNICHLNSQSAVKTAGMQRGEKETTFDPSSAFTQPPPADGPAFPPATSRPAVGSGQRPPLVQRENPFQQLVSALQGHEVTDSDLLLHYTPTTPAPHNINCYVEVPTTIRKGGQCIQLGRFRVPGSRRGPWACQAGIHLAFSQDCATHGRRGRRPGRG
ncbi:hypothetical protein ACOMHN_012093 [Nucella lapillus]